MNIKEFSDDELTSTLEHVRQQIASADSDKDVVTGHDLRCLLDQLTAEQEARHGAAED